jgi:hypothetical protein
MFIPPKNFCTDLFCDSDLSKILRERKITKQAMVNMKILKDITSVVVLAVYGDNVDIMLLYSDKININR